MKSHMYHSPPWRLAGEKKIAALKPLHVVGTIFSDVILERKFIMIIGKKKIKLLWNFFHELTEPFLNLNLP